MPFLNDIAAALERETNEVQANLGSMMVEDSLNEVGLRTVLLFESPHLDEISAEHPLAGSSGRNVTKAFAKYHSNFYHDANFDGPHEPIGCLLRRLQGVDADEQLSEVALNTLNSLGLMNVSRLPLDGDVYSIDVHRRYSDLLCYFGAIKGKLEREGRVKSLAYLRALHSDLHPSMVYAALRDDLIRRLPEDQDVEVIPCGKVANVFHCWAISHRDGVNYEVPNDVVRHPSRGWITHEIRALVELVRERAGA